MKVLVTGATGFVGTHLCEYLLQQGDDVHGTYLYQQEFDRFPVSLKPHVVLHQCDLAERQQVREVVNTVQYDRVYNLAAISSVQKSWEGQDHVLHVNFFGWLHLIEAISDYCPSARVLMISSGEVYGNVPEAEQPINESRPLRPINPYANTKAAQEIFCYQYIHRHNAQIVIVRPFNHTGPRQVTHFVCPDFAKQIAEIERGAREPQIFVGNLEARRDFSDVRDVVRAYHLAIEQCPVGEPINVASGKAIAIQTILNILLSYSTTTIRVLPDANRLRPSDVPLTVGDYSLLNHYTGWQPVIPFEDTLRTVLEYWRGRV